MNQSLNIDELINKNLNVLNKNKLIYCATAHDGRIKSRIVDYYNEGLTIGFITWEDSIKVNHMKYNPAVSLSIENLQIEGKAKFAGHPSLEQNKDFMESYKKRHPVPYKNFIGMKDTILVVVEPVLSIMMIYEHNYFYLDHLDFIQNIAYRNVLSSWNFNL